MSKEGMYWLKSPLMNSRIVIIGCEGSLVWNSMYLAHSLMLMERGCLHKVALIMEAPFEVPLKIMAINIEHPLKGVLLPLITLINVLYSKG